MQESLVERFASSQTTKETGVIEDVNEYVQWQARQAVDGFKPEPSDVMDIQKYLLECHHQGVARAALNRIRASLESFYSWLQVNGLIIKNPFEEYDLKLPLFSQIHNRPRHNKFPGGPGSNEIERLQALNQLAVSTNRASDVQTMLNGTLETLLGVMNLNTAWISLKFDSGFLNQPLRERPAHGFVLAAAHNLPPSLEQSDRYYLKRPPECRCQKMLISGRLKRGVNIVECSRLQDSTKIGGENNNLIFHASVPIIVNDQAIGIMNFAAEEWQLLSASDLQFLTAGVRQVGDALERARLYDQVLNQQKHLKHELDMARKVQISLQPEKLPRIIGYSLAALWKPAYETSGDYYNIFKLPGNRWGFIVADVCDKGAPAALYMALAHGLIRERVESENSPAALLTQVNQALCDQGIKTNFITSLYAILDPEKSTLKYSIAGHPPPLLRKASGQVITLAGKGMALGVIPEAQYVDMDLYMAPGESLVAYTDGLTDAYNPNEKSFQMKNLKTALGSAPTPARALLKHLQNALGNWVKEAPNFDDITLLVIARKEIR